MKQTRNKPETNKKRICNGKSFARRIFFCAFLFFRFRFIYWKIETKKKVLDGVILNVDACFFIETRRKFKFSLTLLILYVYNKILSFFFSNILL